MIKASVPCEFYITEVDQHSEIKDLLLDTIKEMGTYSLIQKSQKIYNSDWHLSPDFNRPYWNIVSPVFIKHLNQVKDYLGLDVVKISNYWFQQYDFEGFHDWHTHTNVMFSSVYFVNLPTKELSTTFRLGSKEFQVDVLEGQILTFPSSFLHASKPNNSNSVKTVISFNSNMVKDEK